MRYVEFSPHALPPGQEESWAKWEQGATTATEAMLSLDREGKAVKPDKETIWRELKVWFLKYVFAGKCAYCEGSYLAGDPQHAEHWRPKGKVTRLDEDEREVAVERDGIPHRGYWWLAYSWENLVPACFLCNTGDGKGTKFPIAGRYAFSPEEAGDVAALNELEKPWLLHPCNEPKPERHIGFYKDGTAYAKEKSEYGFWTIKVMDLNREILVNKRRERQEEAVDRLAQVASDAIRFGVDPDEAMETWEGPGATFSRAVQDRLLPIRNRVGPQIFRQ
jgi:hypothetical protein